MLIPTGISILLHAIAWSQQQTWDIWVLHKTWRIAMAKTAPKPSAIVWKQVRRTHIPPAPLTPPFLAATIDLKKVGWKQSPKVKISVGVKLWISFCQLKRCVIFQWFDSVDLPWKRSKSASGPDLFTCCVLHRLDLRKVRLCPTIMRTVQKDQVQQIYGPCNTGVICIRAMFSSKVLPLLHTAGVSSMGDITSLITHFGILQKPLFGLKLVSASKFKSLQVHLRITSCADLGSSCAEGISCKGHEGIALSWWNKKISPPWGHPQQCDSLWPLTEAWSHSLRLRGISHRNNETAKMTEPPQPFETGLLISTNREPPAVHCIAKKPKRRVKTSCTNCQCNCKSWDCWTAAQLGQKGWGATNFLVVKDPQCCQGKSCGKKSCGNLCSVWRLRPLEPFIASKATDGSTPSFWRAKSPSAPRRRWVTWAKALEVWTALTCDSDKLAKMGPSGIQRIVHGLYCMASTAWTTMDHLPTAFLDWRNDSRVISSQLYQTIPKYLIRF